MGSDIVGLPCMYCSSGQLLDETVLTILAIENIPDSNKTERESGVEKDG